MKPVVVAEEDIEAAYLWYEGRQAHLGNEFLFAIRSALIQSASIPGLSPSWSRRFAEWWYQRVFVRYPLGFDSVSQYPEAQPIVESDVRRVVVPRFPYGIFYRLYHGTVYVIVIRSLRAEARSGTMNRAPRPRRLYCTTSWLKRKWPRSIGIRGRRLLLDFVSCASRSSPLAFSEDRPPLRWRRPRQGW
jgi:hypothetical protein